MHTHVAKLIVNPAASGGRVGRQWPQLEGLLQRSGLTFAAELTKHRGHGTQIARQALDDGHRHIVSVGGDGTVNEVVNGLVVDGSIPADVVLSIIPGGTGSDFARLLGMPRGAAPATHYLLSQNIRAVDIGQIDCLLQGQSSTRYFVNVAGLGFDSEVCVRVNRMSWRVGGTVPYVTSLAMTLFSYANKDVRIVLDGQEVSGRFNSVIVCNGQYFGGGMWIGPRAAADDGIFDVVILEDLNKLEFLLNVPRVYKGTHLTHPKVKSHQAREVRIEAKQRMFIQAEGELVGEAPARLRVIPAALHLRV